MFEPFLERSLPWQKKLRDCRDSEIIHPYYQLKPLGAISVDLTRGKKYVTIVPCLSQEVYQGTMLI